MTSLTCKKEKETGMSNVRNRLKTLAGSYLSTSAEIASLTQSFTYAAIAYSVAAATWTWVTKQ